MKKKNQELEKFKFVLDYKIKELKRQIEPRENEITDMKEQIKEMDQELEQYHKSNAALDLMIGELRDKLDGMQREIMRQRQRLSGRWPWSWDRSLAVVARRFADHHVVIANTLLPPRDHEGVEQIDALPQRQHGDQAV